MNKTLYWAYLLKEQFRLVFQLVGRLAIKALDEWCARARRCLIPGLVELYRRIPHSRDSILATLTNNELSKALVESTDKKLRPLTRIAFGSSPPRISASCVCSIAVTTGRRYPSSIGQYD